LKYGGEDHRRIEREMHALGCLGFSIRMLRGQKTPCSGGVAASADGVVLSICVLCFKRLLNPMRPTAAISFSCYSCNSWLIVFLCVLRGRKDLEPEIALPFQPEVAILRLTLELSGFP
jgi:hypothetical protein